MRLAVVGPPQSGKSIVVVALLEELRRRIPAELTELQPRFIELDLLDPSVPWMMGEIPTRQKGAGFTPENVAAAEVVFREANQAIVIANTGGLISPQNEQLLAHADALLIVSRDAQATQAWREFADRLSLRIFGVLESTLDAPLGTCQWDSVRRRGQVTELDRERLKGARDEGLCALDALRDDVRRVITDVAHDIMTDAFA